MTKSKHPTKHRFQKLAGILKESLDSKDFENAHDALAKWFEKTGKEKLKNKIDSAVKEFYEKAEFVDYEPDGKYYGLTEDLIDDEFWSNLFYPI